MTTIAVAACMKNEGPFVVEWVAHYLAIGFDRVFILTNDCDDGTDLIVDRLVALAPVTHIRNLVPDGGFAQQVGMEVLKSSGHLDTVDWLLHCDADEFLYLHMHDPNIGRFLGGMPATDAVAFDWRYVGTTLDVWTGGLVTEVCPRGSTEVTEGETFSKTIFRPSQFGFFSDHMPKAPVRPDVQVCNSLGQSLPNNAMFHPRKSRYIRGSRDHLSWQAAEMRHYALRSREVFAAKALRGFGIHPKPDKYLVGSRFWRQANRCETELACNPDWMANLKSRVQHYLADPEIARLHAAAIELMHVKMERLKALKSL